MIPSTFILAKDVAAMLGVRTCTLKRWRQLGKGPRGFAYLGETVVVYTRESVERFIESVRIEAQAGEDDWRERDFEMLPRFPTPPSVRAKGA
jgi:hypothetical protein